MAKNSSCKSSNPSDGGLRELHTFTMIEQRRKLNRNERNVILPMVRKWADSHLKLEEKGNTVERFSKVDLVCGTQLIIRKRYFGETYSKNRRNRKLSLIMELSCRFLEWMPQASFCGNEAGIHHSGEFSVYRVLHNGIHIEFKTYGNSVYYMHLLPDDT